MQIPTLEEESEQVVEDAAAVIDWADHVRPQVRKAIDMLGRLAIDERENAARLCEDMVEELGWTRSAAVAERIRTGKRASPRGEGHG